MTNPYLTEDPTIDGLENQVLPGNAEELLVPGAHIQMYRVIDETLVPHAHYTLKTAPYDRLGQRVAEIEREGFGSRFLDLTTIGVVPAHINGDIGYRKGFVAQYLGHNGTNGHH